MAKGRPHTPTVLIIGIVLVATGVVHLNRDAGGNVTVTAAACLALSSAYAGKTVTISFGVPAGAWLLSEWNLSLLTPDAPGRPS